MRKTLWATGILLYLLAGFLGICLIGVFVVSVIQWNFGRWWFWPAGIATCMSLSVLGYLSMFAADYKQLKSDPLYLQYGIPTHQPLEELKIPPPNQISTYRWGKTQGWLSILLGIFNFAMVPNAAMLIASGVSIITGIGLIRRRRYGVVLVYVSLTLVVLEIAAAFAMGVPNRDFYPAITVALAFWGIPAIFYYPQRWRKLK